METTEKKIREVKTVKRFLKNLSTVVQFLKDDKKTFTLSYTSYSATIKIKGVKKTYLFTKDGTKNDFTLLNKLKQEIKKSDLYVDSVRTDKIKYFSLTNLEKCFYKKVYNVDITDCYPTTLKNLGFISDDFYKTLSEVPKIKKLRTIGQIATKKGIYEFVNGQQQRFYFKQDEYLRNVFFVLCQHTGDVINECKMFCPSFLFFWFDGIYFKNKRDAKKVKEILTKHGYRFKEETLTNFTVKKTKDKMYIDYDKNDGSKSFVLPINLKNKE